MPRGAELSMKFLEDVIMKMKIQQIPPKDDLVRSCCSKLKDVTRKGLTVGICRLCVPRLVYTVQLLQSGQCIILFLCPRNEMAEGHIEFTLSVCVFVYSRIVSGPKLSRT